MSINLVIKLQDKYKVLYPFRWVSVCVPLECDRHRDDSQSPSMCCEAS